jgi:predicted TIM-barrel fold metal-dependent hydrolase
MLTRRRWLSLIPGGLIPGGLIPGSLMPAGLAAGQAIPQAPAPFERVDTHVHLNRLSRPILSGLQTSGWKILSICVSRATGDDPSDLEAQLRGNAEMSRESEGRVAWAGSFDARRWPDADFADSTIAALRQQFRQGAIAVKIWKNIGMSLRTRTGRYLLPDDRFFQPVYQMLEKEGRTLVAHLGEPNGAWMPLNDNNPEKGFYSTHPEWHMYGRPDAPLKEDILRARDRIAVRYPKLRLVGCHLGSNEEDLNTLAARLDRLPNFAVDLAARVRYLAAGDRSNAREFLVRYQDRVMYGTDFTLGAGGDDSRAWNSLAAQHDRDWQYFASADTVTYNREQVRGLGLPSDVLRKIFRENALRFFPGIG